MSTQTLEILMEGDSVIETETTIYELSEEQRADLDLLRRMVEQDNTGAYRMLSKLAASLS